MDSAEDTLGQPQQVIILGKDKAPGKSMALFVY